VRALTLDLASPAGNRSEHTAPPAPGKNFGHRNGIGRRAFRRGFFGKLRGFLRNVPLTWQQFQAKSSATSASNFKRNFQLRKENVVRKLAFIALCAQC